MWICIYFFADPGPAVLLNADPDPALKFFWQINFWRVLWSWKRQIKDCSKVKNYWADPNLLYFLIKLLLLPISLHFFSFFPSWIRIHEVKIMRIRIHSPGIHTDIVNINLQCLRIQIWPLVCTKNVCQKEETQNNLNKTTFIVLIFVCECLFKVLRN